MGVMKMNLNSKDNFVSNTPPFDIQIFVLPLCQI